MITINQISTRQILTTTLIATILLSSYGAVKYHFQHLKTIELAQRNAVLTQQRLQYGLPLVMWNYDEAGISGMIDGEIKSPFLQSIIIFDTDNKPLHSSIQKNEKKYSELNFPINYDGNGKKQNIGHGEISLSATQIDFQLGSLLLNIALEILFLDAAIVFVLLILSRMSNKIIANEQKYRALVENVQDVIFQLNEHKQWSFVNPAWTTITGFEKNETIGTLFVDSLYHEDTNKALAIIEQLRSNSTHPNNTHSKHDLRFNTAHGTICWLELTLQYEIDTHTKALSFNGTLNDITERRRITQLQSEFVSVVSHELRTPITSIRGALSILDSGKVGTMPDVQLKLVQIAHKNSQRLVTLVNDILDMEKLMAGKMDMTLENINLAVLVETAVEANNAYAQALQVKLHFNAPSFNTMVLLMPIA